MGDVFRTFLRLGLTSFGGPIAHLGYFRREFVERRKWIDERLFTHVVAFCSVLPGPTSSQVGMIIGWLRAGPGGAFAAWLGFTLPSALALTVFALLLTAAEGAAAGAQPRWLTGLLAGLGAAATAVVAQAVLGMTKSLCIDRITQTIALGSAVLALALRDGTWQWVPIAAGAVAGLLAYARALPAPLPEPDVTLPIRLPRAVPAVAAGAFIALVGATAFAGRQSAVGSFLATILRAGSLVFGGGHVVLPLLQTLVPAGLVRVSDFYAGYGATQAVPGPLFTFAAFLGTVNASTLHGPVGALVATILIFLPSFLLVFALLPVLGALTSRPAAAGALRGANAAVVGLLGALLYAPLIVMLGTSVWRVAIALGAYALVAVWKTPPWVAVACAAAAGVLVAQAGSFA